MSSSALRKNEKWKHAAIASILALQLFPVYMMLQIGFKDNLQFVRNPWLPAGSAPHLENFTWALWFVLPYMANTIFVAALCTLGTLAAALAGAFFFARRKLPFSGLMWGAFMLLLLMPTVTNIVPLFSQLRNLGLLNSLWALILVGIAGAQAVNIYVLRGFIEEIPRDLFEAADIDGASYFHQLIHVVFPLSLPILGTLGIVTFLGQWNDFLLPLMISRDKSNFTLGVGLIYLEGEYVKEWGRIMAAYCLSSLPLVLLFLFTMKWFVRGLSSGAVKG